MYWQTVASDKTHCKPFDLLIPEQWESQEDYDIRVETFFDEKKERVDDDNQGRRPLYSVLSDGKLHVEIDERIGYHQPEEPYHYE